MNYNRKALKQEARALVQEARPKAWLVTLVFVLLAVVLPQVITGLLNHPVRGLIPQIVQKMADMIRQGQEPDELGMLGTAGQMVSGSLWITFVSVLLGLFTIVMSYGYQNYALRLFRRQETGVDTVFSGFPLAGWAIGTEVMTTVFIFFWFLLIEIVGLVALWLGMYLFWAVDWLATVWIIAVMIAVMLAIVLISLRYCLAPYFVLSDPDRGVFDSITASKRAMQGNYIKKLALDLSFLGWGLLVRLITCLVTIIGVAVVLFTAGDDWLLSVQQASQMVMTDQQAAQFVIRSIIDLIASDMVPMSVVFCLAWLVTLPLNLWLRAYETVADAGFFLTVTGQAIIVDGEPEDMDIPATPHAFFGIPVEPIYPVPTQSEEPPAEEPAVEEPQSEEPPADEPQTPAE